MTGETFASGGCRCGAIQYTIKAAPLRMAQCHCIDCQKASGTGHLSLAFFKAQDVDVTGTPAGYTITADSGNEKTQHFCPTCGSPLHLQNSARSGIVGIPVGVLDDHSWFEPQVVVYTRHKAAWDITTDAVPNFEAMPTG